MKIKQTLTLLLCLALSLAGCSEPQETGGTASRNDLTSCPALIREAMSQVREDGVSALSLDVLHNKGHLPTRSAGQSPTELSVDWAHYRVLTDGEGEYGMVDLRGETSVILSLQVFGGKKRQARNRSVSKLFVRRTADGRLEAFVGTYVFDRKYERKHSGRVDTLGLDFPSMRFSGYFFVSRLNGEALYGRYYEKGEAKFLFMPTVRLDHAAWAEADTLLHVSFQSETDVARTRSSASRALSSEGGFPPCSFCGRSLESCTCWKAVGCEYCKQTVRDGVCGCVYCPMCGQNKTAGACLCSDDSRCEVCLLDKDDCICDKDSWQDGQDTGLGGGSSGGGSAGGGGFIGSGGSGHANGIYGISRIRKGVNQAVNEFKSLYIKDGVYLAACNFGVQRIFALVVGAGTFRA